jgi:hypothetical protein
MERNHHNMQNKKIIRFVESFVLLPIITLSGQVAPMPKIDVVNVPQIILSTKQNIENNDLFTVNKETDHDEVLKLQAEAIDAYYRKYDMPLEGMGMKMAVEAKKNNIDWRLVPAISVIESTGGKFACKRVTHSFLGWGSCKINFESDERAIEIVSWNLGGGNPNTARYYANKSTPEKLTSYNPPSVVPDYTQKVMKVMNAIGEENLVKENS